jgi:hypothetical protein
MSLGQVRVKEFGDVSKGLMRLGRGVVGEIIPVGHGTAAHDPSLPLATDRFEEY